MGDLPVIDVLSPAFWDDPHRVLRNVRDESSMARTSYGALVLLGYDDCVAALADLRLVNDYDSLLTRSDITEGPLWDWWQLAMLNNNPPVHTRLRGLVSRAFTPRAVARAEDITRAHTGAIVDRAVERGTIELVHELCEPMPLTVVCEMIGFPRSDVGEFDRWVADLGMMFSERVTPDMRATAEQAMLSLGGYVADHVASRARRGERADDLLDALVESAEDGDRLSTDELIAMVVNLLFGALDTSRGALSMMLAILVQRPDLLGAMRGDPALFAPAVEELLRFEPPVGEITRVAAEPLAVNGVDVPAGALVGMSVLAANRDPARFAAAHEIDFSRYARREEASVLSFGRGIHHCLGSALARLELRAALETIVQRCATIELDGPAPRHVPFLRVRCIESLPVTVSGAETRASGE